MFIWFIRKLKKPAQSATRGSLHSLDWSTVDMTTPQVSITRPWEDDDKIITLQVFWGKISETSLSSKYFSKPLFFLSNHFTLIYTLIFLKYGNGVVNYKVESPYLPPKHLILTLLKKNVINHIIVLRVTETQYLMVPHKK